MAKIDSDTLYGTLGLILMKTVEDEPLHGLAISRQLRRVSDDALRVEEGALYPALHRLERDGYLTSSWGRSANNRRAKYYELTAKGRKQLRAEAVNWTRHAAAVSRLLNVRLAGP